jgi:hypothetical protein
MDVFEGILVKMDAGHPCRHDGELHFHSLWASVRLNHFMLIASCDNT